MSVSSAAAQDEAEWARAQAEHTCRAFRQVVRWIPITTNISFLVAAVIAFTLAMHHWPARWQSGLFAAMAALFVVVTVVSTAHHLLNAENEAVPHRRILPRAERVGRVLSVLDVTMASLAGIASFALAGWAAWRAIQCDGLNTVVPWALGIAGVALGAVVYFGAADVFGGRVQRDVRHRRWRSAICNTQMYDVLHAIWHIFAGFLCLLVLIVTSILLSAGQLECGLRAP